MRLFARVENVLIDVLGHLAKTAVVPVPTVRFVTTALLVVECLALIVKTRLFVEIATIVRKE